MDKLTLQDIDWSSAPEDAEEVATYGGKPYGMWYKNITSTGYCFRYTEDRSWSFSSGEPLFKERAKRPSNIFTKSMLVAGKHIVEVRHPYDGVNRYEVLSLDDGTLILQGIGLDGGSYYLDYYNENLDITVDSTFDIMKVFTREYAARIQDLKLIWERTPTKVPTQKELQLAALQDTINKAQEQIEELMKEG